MTTVTKRDARLPASAFAWDAAGLGWLAEAGGTAVASVVAVDADSLTTVRIEPVPPTRSTAEHLGRSLARTHAYIHFSSQATV